MLAGEGILVMLRKGFPAQIPVLLVPGHQQPGRGGIRLAGMRSLTEGGVVAQFHHRLLDTGLSGRLSGLCHHQMTGR